VECVRGGVLNQVGVPLEAVPGFSEGFGQEDERG